MKRKRRLGEKNLSGGVAKQREALAGQRTNSRKEEGKGGGRISSEERKRPLLKKPSPEKTRERGKPV